MGIKSFAADTTKITKADIKTGKNYLNEKAFRRFEILYDQLLSFVKIKVMNDNKIMPVIRLHSLLSRQA